MVLLLFFFVALLAGRKEYLCHGDLFCLLLLLFNCALLFVCDLYENGAFSGVVPFLVPLLVMLRVNPVSLLVSRCKLGHCVMYFYVSMSLLLICFLCVRLLTIAGPGTTFSLVSSGSLMVLAILSNVPHIMVGAFIFMMPLFTCLLLFVGGETLECVLIIVYFFMMVLSRACKVLLKVLKICLVCGCVLGRGIRLVIVLFLFLVAYVCVV